MRRLQMLCAWPWPSLTCWLLGRHDTRMESSDVPHTPRWWCMRCERIVAESHYPPSARLMAARDGQARELHARATMQRTKQKLSARNDVREWRIRNGG